MKILQIASGDFFSTYGGGQVYVKNLVDELIRQQRNVSVISFITGTARIEKKSYQNIELYEVGNCETAKLQALITAISPDIIHAHSHKAVVTQIGKALHIPVIITAHHGGILCPAGTLMNSQDEICQTTVSHQHCLCCCLKNIRSGKHWYPFMRLLPPAFYLKTGKSLEKLPFLPFITPIGQVALSIDRKQKEWQTITNGCTRMIAPSHGIKDAMIRNGIKKEKVIVVPHGIPLPEKKFSAPLKENEPIKFFYVGRICHVKGIHILLKAFHELNNSKAELHLIGGAENKIEKRYMKRLQKKYDSDSQIIWHGKVKPEKIFDMIREYHILIHPTICLEIFGLNIAEAQAMGKPVLATRCGGAEMQIEEPVNGWLVEPNNDIALRNKMEEVIRNFHNTKTMLSDISMKVISMEEHIKTLSKIYSQIV